MARRNKDFAAGENVSEFLEPLIEDDEFLTELSLGKDPSGGEDELAALFLELREDVNRPMPPAPIIEGADEEPVVISLAAARKRRNRPFLNGLIGAAAATVVLAGSGVAIYNSGPTSPLYGANQALFGGNDEAAMVDLASTLDELESATASGDTESARELLAEARRLASQAQGDRQAVENSTQAPRTTTVTETVEVTPEPETETPPAEVPTITERVTETAVATVTVVETAIPNPLPVPTDVVEPTEPGQPGEGTQPTLAPPQTP